MHGDGFGCLHTEDISGHKIEGLPFLRKNTRRCTYAPQDAAVNSEGTRLRGVPKVQQKNDMCKGKPIFFCNITKSERGVPKVLQISQIYNHLIFSGLQTCYRTQERLISE